MDLNFTPEDQAFRVRVREWFAANTPRQALTTLDERRAWIRKLYDAGFVGMGWPKEYGGAGLSIMEQAILNELESGNMPAFLRRLKPVTLQHTLDGGRVAAVTIFVTPGPV